MTPRAIKGGQSAFIPYTTIVLTLIQGILIIARAACLRLVMGSKNCGTFTWLKMTYVAPWGNKFNIWRHPWHLFMASQLGITVLEEAWCLIKFYKFGEHQSLTAKCSNCSGFIFFLLRFFFVLRIPLAIPLSLLMQLISICSFLFCISDKRTKQLFLQGRTTLFCHCHYF